MKTTFGIQFWVMNSQSWVNWKILHIFILFFIFGISYELCFIFMNQVDIFERFRVAFFREFQNVQTGYLTMYKPEFTTGSVVLFVLFIPFSVFCFWSVLATKLRKIRKYYIIFVCILQGTTDKRKKTERKSQN